MQKLLITIGLILVIAGFMWPWLNKLPFGKLPGDFLLERPEFKVYIPNNEKVNIQIFSLEGNLQLEQENVTNNQTINILNKTAGIYLINIISQEKVDCHKMIIY